MNGLERLDDLQASRFIAALLGRRPKENAFIEIHNLVASLPIYHISEDAIAGCLMRHNVKIGEGKSRLLNIYSQVLEYFIRDFSISDDELSQLQHLANILKITSDEASQIHTAIVYPYYEMLLREVLQDRHITEEEEATLDALSAKLRIPESEVKEIRKKLIVPIYNQAVRDVLADDLLSPQEEAELEKLAKSLRIKIRWEGNSEATFKRARYLWQIAEGKLPYVTTPINLQFNERCAAYVEASHYEHGAVTQGISYSGFSASYSAFGIRFHSGIVNTQRLSSGQLLYRGAGTLYFTNKRLLFDGDFKSTSIYLHKIISITFYSDGMQIEKDSGKDQVFLFSGDMDVLRLIANNLMSLGRGDTSAKSTYSSSSGKKKSTAEPKSQPSNCRSPYEVLEISSITSMEEIKIAYRKMSAQYHPDKVASLGRELRELAEKKMKEINIAYEALKHKR